jgi:hypothetical protein
MTERFILLQRIANQRGERPGGLRIWSDGLVARRRRQPAARSTEHLDADRDLSGRTNAAHPERVGTIGRRSDSGFFDLPPRLLINTVEAPARLSDR